MCRILHALAKPVKYEERLAAAAKDLSLAQARRDALIKEAAQKGGLSRREIAAAVGLSFARVQQIIRGAR